MKISETFEYGGYPQRKKLTDKAFIKLWQLSTSIEDFKEKEESLFNQYKDDFNSKEGFTHNLALSEYGWTPFQRAAYFKKIGVPLKELKSLQDAASIRAAYIEELKRYAVEVLEKNARGQ